MGLYDKFDPFAGVDIDVDELHREAKAMDAAIAARPEPVAPQPASSTFRRIAGDTAITALKGAIGLPESVVGIADIATGGRTGKALETIGYRPAEAKEILSDFYTPEQKAAFGRVSQADGFVPTLQALAEDPSVAAHSVVESLPSMLGGAGVARSALKVAPKLAPWVAGAAGEGVISAGQAAESIRQESADGLLTPKQAGLSVLAGGGVGLTSGVAGKLATKLGIADIDTMLASGNRSAINKSILRQIGESALSEGVLEEMPQSAWEQVLQNVALDRPWYEGVGSASAQGFVAGGLMGAAGGGFNALGSRPSSETVSATNQELPMPPATSQAAGLPAGGVTPPGGAIDNPSITPPIAGARDMGDIPEFGGPMVAREAAPAAPVSNGPIGMALAAGGITNATMYQDFAANPFAEAPAVQPGGPAIAGQQVSDLLNAAKAPTELEQANRWADAVVAQGGGAATAVMNLRAADRTGQALVSEWKRRTRHQAIAGTTPVPGGIARDSQPGKTTQVDQAAHTAATSPTNSLPEPTTAQIEAGNYKKGHLKLHGLDISVENPAGSIRKGVDETGREWQTNLAHHYGYIKGTVGRDKDHIDIFVGPQPESNKLYVVDQLNTKTGKFDEHKVMAGFASAAEAQAGYLANYDQTGPQRIGNITEATPEQFKQWLSSGNTKQAFASQALATKTVASQNQVTMNDKRRSVKPDQDDLIVAMAKLGGLNREQATAQWGSTLNDMVRDLNLHATKNGKAGFLHAIAKTGRNLDEMRELLEEYGYLQPGSSIEDMYAKIEAATRGQQSYSNQREYREDEAYPFDLEGINFPGPNNPKGTSHAIRNARRGVAPDLKEELTQEEGVAEEQKPAQRDPVKHRAFLQRMLAQARTPKAKKQIKRALERLDAKAQQLNTQPDAAMYRDLAGFKTQPDTMPVGAAATADSEALAAEIDKAVLTPSGTFAKRKVHGQENPHGTGFYPLDQSQKYLNDVSKHFEEKFKDVIFILDEEEQKANLLGGLYAIDRLPQGAEQAGLVGQLAAAARVAARGHRANGLADVTGGTDRTAIGKFWGTVKSNEKRELIKWANEHGLMIDAAEFTKRWNAQGSKQGAEHHVYFTGDNRVIKRSLSPNASWMQYFQRLALHNYLFPDVAYNLAGFMVDNGQLFAVVEQPLIKADRDNPVSFDEIVADMQKRGFVAKKNQAMLTLKLTGQQFDEYWNDFGVMVHDLHTANVFRRYNGGPLAYIDSIITLDPATKRQRLMERYGLQEKHPRNTAKHKAFLQRMLHSAKSDKARETARKALQRLEARTKPVPATIDDEINSMSLDDMAALFNQAVAEAAAPAPVRNRAKLQEARRKFLAKQLAKSREPKEQRRLQSALEKLQAAQARLWAEQMPEQPAGKPDKDESTDPYFKKGDRVQFANGVHGEVIEVTSYTWQSAVIDVDGSGLVVKKMEERPSHSYKVRKDNGVEVNGWFNEMFKESEPAPDVVPGPVFDGKTYDPDALLRSITYKRSQIDGAVSHADRSRKPEKKAAWQKDAESFRKEASGMQAAFDAWAKQYPEEAAKYAPQVQPSVPPAPAAAGTGIEGLKVTFNTEKNGIELRFNSKPDDAILAKIKANGFTWGKARRVWYTKDTPAKRAFVEELQGNRQAKAEAEKPKTNADKMREAGAAAFAAGSPRIPQDPWLAGAEMSAGMKEAWLKGWDAANLAAPATEAKTIWNDDGTNGPVLITAPPAKPSLDKAIELAENEITEKIKRAKRRLRDNKDPLLVNSIELEISKLRREMGRVPEKVRAEYTPSERSASSILSAAASSGVKGADEALKGLYELFGGKSLKAFPGAVDEETYRAARPHFDAALENFRAAGKSLREFFAFLIDQFGSGIQPYVMKYMQEKQQESGILEVTEEEEVSHDNTADDSTGQGSLESDQPGSVSADGGQQRPGKRSRGSSQTDADGNADPDEGGAVRSGGVASQPGAVHTGNAGSDSTGVQRLTTPSEPRTPQLSGDNPGNYRITAADDLGGGTRGDKIKHNLAAIRLVKQLDKEGRYPTKAEQAVLVKYVGWGGLKSVFDPNSTKPQDQKARTELEQLLTEAEYFEARQSVLNAHYTSPEIIGSIYNILQHMGFKGGNVLEPTYGSGNFIGLMPEQMAAASKWYGSELDPITSKIGKFLYPDAQLLESGFQEAEFPYGKFDLAIGNPPFGSEQITDTNKKRAEINRFKIHNYVIAKSGMHLRPGGVMAVVVTSRFMDTANPEARDYLAKQFKFLTAIRLPNDAFAKNAGTEVTTDLVFFQKLMPGELPEDQYKGWLETNSTMTNAAGEEITLNKWFAKRPELMLGEPSMKGTMYGGQWRKEDGKGEFTLNARPGQDTAAEIEKLLQDDILFGKVKDLFTPSVDQADAAAISLEMNREDVGIGGYVEENGTIFMREDDDQNGNPVFVKLTADTPWTEKQTLGETRLNRIKGMLELRKAAYALIEAERFDLSDMEAKRKELNKLYDAFVSKHGFLSDTANASLMADDVKIESGLEANYRKAITAAKAKTMGVKPQPARADKAAIMKQRVFFPVKEITSAANARDGYGISLSEKGRLDLAYIAGLTGQTTDEVTKELADEGLIFKDPATGAWQQEDEYLSGNVKAKLEKALGREGYEKNVEALTAVLPKDVTPEEIFADLGATWIPAQVYKDFADLMGVTNANVLVIPETGTVKIISGGHVQNDMNVMLQNNDHDVASLINHIAAKQAVVAYDHIDDGNGGSKRVVNKDRTKALVPMVKRVSATFRDWLMADPRRAAELTKIYNDTMNTHAPRLFNGKHLKTVGASPAVRLRNSQRNAAWRMLQSPVVLLDHVVGAGKTFTIITGVMERKRLGLSSKSMIVVPNHLVGQWGADFLKLYPGARILATTEKDFAKANRKRLFARIATGNYDAVIVGHSSFGFIPLEAETQREFVMEEISYLERALMMAEQSKDKRLIRNLTEKIAKKRERIKSLMNKERDDVVTFENMGVDNLVVDESHEFKNLEYSTSMQNITGMGNPNGAKKSFDLYAKIQYLRGKDGAITFATGTPISNSLVEMYTILRYLNRQGLKDRNLDVFDAWAKAYASIESRIEYTPSQKLKDRQVMATFNNLPELLQLYSEFADVIGMKDLKRIYAEQIKESNKETGANEREEFPVPKVKNGARYLDVADPTTAQRQYMDYLVARANRLEKLGGQNDPKTDNHLWLMNDARKMALDIRLVDPSAPSDPNNKVNRAANNIKRIYDKWDADKGTQLVFCDLSTPAGSSKSEAAKFIKSAQAVIGMEKDKALSNVLSSLTYTEQWAYLKNRIEREVERLDQAEQNDANEAAREKLEKFLESVGDEEISTLNTVDTGFSVYDDLKATLIAKGIPANEIRFIHEANTRDQKTELFNMVNSGLVRVLIGSSRKMGAGTNAQERLVALHHMDAPWRPSDVEQREGRIIRQGNVLYERDPDGFEIEIPAYSTRNTFDSVSWQILARKAEMLEDFRGGARTMQDSDSDAASYSEFMAESTGNPIFREKFKLEREIEELESTERNIMARRAAGERIVKNADADIAKAEKSLQTALQDMAVVKDAKVFEVDGKKYADDLTGAYNKAFTEYEAAYKEYSIKLLPEYVAARAEIEAQELSDKDQKEALKQIKKPVEPAKPTLPRLEKTSQAARAALRVSELLDDIADRGEVEFHFGGAQVVIQKVPIGNGVFDFKTYINGAPRWGLSANGLKHMSQQKLMDIFSSGEIVSRVAADLRVARAAVDSVKQSIEDAERTLSKLKFEDADRLRAMQERYKAVVEEVNQLEKEMDQKREQEANVYISGDSRRFGTDTPVTSGKKDTVVFARGGSGARGLDVADVNKAASAIIATFPGSPQVSVVKNFAALPKAIQAEAIKQEVGESFPGVLDGKQAFVLADNLDSVAHLETVLLHEIMGHYSIKQLFGSREIEKLNDLFRAMGGMPGLLTLARENQWDTVTDYARGFAKAGYDAETRRALMVHELLAHQAQIKRPALIKAIKEYIGAIKAWLREHGFTWLPKTSTNDLAYVLRQAREVMTSPADMTGGMHFMTAWHGSPHDYDKFDSSKIRTGEGAQVYGYGLYFAGSKEVAEWYRDKFSKRPMQSLNDKMNQILVDGEPILNSYQIEMDELFADQLADGQLDLAIEHAEDRLEKWEELSADESYPYRDYAKDKASVWNRLVPKLRDGKVKSKAKGRLYKVELAPAEDEYLLWDKPLSEQSEKVKAALAKLAAENDIDLAVATKFMSNNGELLYLDLSQRKGSDRAASEYLHSLGIRGIKYLNGSSRNSQPWRIQQPAENNTGKWRVTQFGGNNAQTFDNEKDAREFFEKQNGHQYNYVIFNDEDIVIADKYSLSSTPPSGLKAADLQREFAGLPFASRIKVVQSSSGLPGGGPNSQLLRVEGQYKDGVIYLVADNLPSAERAKVVALGHELTHAGQSAKLLDMSVQWFQSAQAKGDNGSAFQKAAMIILRQEALKRGYNIIKPDDFRQAVQEATAVIAETAYRTGETNGLLKRLLMHLKHFLRNKLGMRSLPFTDTELVAVVVEMMANGQRNMTDGTGPDGETHYSLASTAADAVADIDWHAMADQVRNNWKQTVNPLDFSRTAGWFDDWTPENVKAAFGYLFAVPHFQAERDQAKRVFVSNAESREIERMDLMLQFLGYNPGEGDTRTTSERMKDFLTKWESGQAHTDWEKINQSWAKLPKDQQAAFDALMVEGDANNSRYSYLKQALTNPRIARTKPNQATFDLYLQVRNHIDNHVKEARINALERMMLESGMDKARVDKHISDFRNELREVRGWFTRSHGEGDQVVNVYHKIDKTRFMQDWATVQVGDNKQQAKLKYYPGKDIAEAVYQIAAEHEYTVAPMAHGGLVVTTTAGADLDAFYQQLAERVGAIQGDILVKRYARYQWTKGAAARHAEEIQTDLKKAMPHNYRPEHEYVVKVQPVDKLTEELYQEMKSDFAVEQALTQTAEKALQRGDMSKEEYRKFKVDLVQDTAEVLMGRAAGRYQIRRAPYLIEGYDTSNTLSLYQDYMMGVAGMLSKADYARKQFEAYRAADTKVKPWAAKYIFDGLRNQGLGDRISGNLRAFASLWYMGLKPASALINATQIYTLGYAELGRYVKSPLKHIARASRDVVAGKLATDEELIFETAVYKQQEMASAMGEITGHNEGTTGKAGKLLRAVTSKSLALFQNVEVVNRKAMILAAYRALKNQETRVGVIDQEAFEKAIAINDSVNFNMHRGNLPGWARGPVGRTMYALQSFTFNTLNWMFNRMTSGEQRDMIALLRYAGAITVLGGVAALPGGDELDKLYRRLFGKSVKLEFQNFTRKNLKQYGMVGELVDSFAWHGAAGAAGVNISNSMRLQLPVISQVLSGETVSESATGVFGGLIRKGNTALTAAAKGDWYRATEAAAPEAISGVMRAARQYNRGVTTLSGKQVYDEQGQPLKYSAADAALRGLGLQPLDQSKRTETTWIGRELAAEWNSQRQDQIDALRIAKTPEDRRAAVRSIMNWNRELQASQVWGLVLPISAKTISNAMNQRISGTDKRRAAWQQSRLQ